jgi:IS1 family transposase
MNQLPFETRVRIVAALVEGNSIRSTERIVGCTRNAIMRFSVTAGEACERLHDALVRDVEAKVIQCDELWSFIQKKRRQLRAGDPAEWGDAYTYLGIDATTKLVLAYTTGKRNAENTQFFMADLASRIVGRPQITTDALQFYRAAVELAFAPDVDFAQIEKKFETPITPEAAGRYSPGRIIREDKRLVTGRFNLDQATTSHVERMNLSVRMGLRRFTRLTNGYSKKARNLRAAVALFVAYFNFCRVHEALRVTPAMAAGLTDHVWSLGELLRTALDMPPVPAPSAPVTPDPEPIAVGMSAKQAGGLTARYLRSRQLRVIKGGRA